MKWLAGFMSIAAFAAAPTITELQPRGAQKGRPFTLTLVGKDLGEGAKIRSSMPATFTPMSPEKTGPMTDGRYATFLVEPQGELAVGVYPIRVETPDGISNIQLFTVGSFAEVAEDESRPGALPNSNDTMETAQVLNSSPLTVNGTLRGPERDLFRFYAKAGERRVFEVEARRAGSAIDPVMRIIDASGKVLARSEDAPLLGLDARLEATFPKEGYYYAEVHDARYSTQAANFYRLKMGNYEYPQEIFPLGGRRGSTAQAMLGAQKITADLSHIDPKLKQIFVNVSDSPSLPVPFAVGDDPEVLEPVAGPLAAPVTINGRIAKAAEVDRYTFNAAPGEWLSIRVEARTLGTSKLMAVITAFDAKGKQLGRSGDEALAEDLFNVNQSRTAGDPILRVQAPADGAGVTIAIEDLALRGGPGYAYRLNVQRMMPDFRVLLSSAYVNVPAGGSAIVPVAVERRGFEGEIELRLANPPAGLRQEGGFVPAGAAAKDNVRNRISRGVLILTADANTPIAPGELIIEGVAKAEDGSPIVRKAEGPGMLVGVTGATQQGSVDRQRAITAPWLGLQLPMGETKAQPATLVVTMLERKRMAEGDQIKFQWKWTRRDPMVPLPKNVNADIVGAADVRVIDSKVDPKDPEVGTFMITTTKLTLPSRYDMFITGRLMIDGQPEEVVSRPIVVDVKEVKTDVAEASTSR